MFDEDEEEEDGYSSPSADWRTTDLTDESVQHRVYVNLGSLSQGSHLFDDYDNTTLKDFLDGVLAYVGGVLWQHAAIATDIEVLAVIPLHLSATEFADRLRFALAKYLTCTRLAENDLEPFRFAVRESYNVDSPTFLHERDRIMKLRIVYARLCAMPVRGSDTLSFPKAGRTRRKRRL